MAKLIKTWHNQETISSQYSVNEDGVRNGECRTWDKLGNLESQCNYVDGKIVGTKKFYGHKGQVVREIDYDFDGCPFIIKFFADEWTEEEARAIGLVPEIEGLTLSRIMDRFHQVIEERNDFEAKLLKQVSPPKTPQAKKLEILEGNPKVTFT